MEVTDNGLQPINTMRCKKKKHAKLHLNEIGENARQRKVNSDIVRDDCNAQCNSANIVIV